MDNFQLLILHYPYPWVEQYRFIAMMILVVGGLIAYGLYKLITWKMNACLKGAFDSLIILAVGLYIILSIFDMTFSLITIHHVNKQMGFTYATPVTPEGEPFEIQKVVPGKAMDKAGLKPFDHIQMGAVNDLYRLLINNQGKEVVIQVKRDKQLIDIFIKVPDLYVPLAGVSFIIMMI